MVQLLAPLHYDYSFVSWMHTGLKHQCENRCSTTNYMRKLCLNFDGITKQLRPHAFLWVKRIALLPTPQSLMSQWGFS